MAQTLHVGGTAYGTLPAIVDTDGITPTTPSALTCLVIKNGTDTGDSVTITAVGGGRTGVYKWSYNPAGDAEGDKYSLVFTITIDSVDYYYTEDLIVFAVERGTDGANTTTPPTAYQNSQQIASDLNTLDEAWADAKLVLSQSTRSEMDANSTKLAQIITDVAAVPTAIQISTQIASDVTGLDNGWEDAQQGIAVFCRTELDDNSTQLAQIITDVAAVPTNTEMTAAFTEIKGATWTSTDTLEGIYDGLGGGGGGDASQTTLLEVLSLLEAGAVPPVISRAVGRTLKAYVGETVTFPVITPTDVNGTTLDTTGIPLYVVIEGRSNTDIQVIADAAITKTSTTIQFTTSAITNATTAQKRWSARRVDNDVVVAHGPYVVEYAAIGD
jgi:hypothetical protein